MKNRADELPPIEVTQPDKLTIVPFTTFPGFEIAPSFSPDGNEIVFSWFGYEKEFQFDLYIKQVGQEHVVQLTHHPAIFLASAWSPDGRLIAFMRQADPENTGIYFISPLGGAERKVASITASGGWEPLGVSWSPDGKWLAFSKGNSHGKESGLIRGPFQHSPGECGNQRRATTAGSFRGLREHLATRIFTRWEISRLGVCACRGRRQNLFANP